MDGPLVYLLQNNSICSVLEKITTLIYLFLLRLLVAHTPIDLLLLNIFNIFIEEWILEAKTDCYGKDQLFVASFVFCAITFEPIII